MSVFYWKQNEGKSNFYKFFHSDSQIFDAPTKCEKFRKRSKILQGSWKIFVNVLSKYIASGFQLQGFSNHWIFTKSANFSEGFEKLSDPNWLFIFYLRFFISRIHRFRWRFGCYSSRNEFFEPTFQKIGQNANRSKRELWCLKWWTS